MYGIYQLFWRLNLYIVIFKSKLTQENMTYMWYLLGKLGQSIKG